MDDFVYSYPAKQYFGTDAAKRAFENELSKYGKRVMLAYGSGSVIRNGIYNELVSLLEANGKEIIAFSGIMPNPTYEKVQEGARLARESGIDFILAVGGGSVIDCCKIISSQACTEEDIWEMEFTDGRLPAKQLPMGAVVTASGTGAEQNSGAVITNEKLKIKTGVFGAHYDFAVLDARYTLSLPMRQVISGAFDTLSHCMETYFGTGGEYNLSDDINEAVMRSVIKNIRAVKNDNSDLNARSELMWASAMGENGILKIGKKTDFECHQMEHQLGAYTNCNHGEGLAILHPVYYRHIYKNGLHKFRRFATEVWGIDPGGKTEEEIARGGIDALADFIREIGMPSSFREIGIDASVDLRAVAKSCNIVPTAYKVMTSEEILEIFKECL